MTKAEKEIETAQRVAENLAKRLGTHPSNLVWLGKKVEITQQFINVDGKESTRIAVSYDRKCNITHIDILPW